MDNVEHSRREFAEFGQLWPRANEFYSDLLKIGNWRRVNAARLTDLYADQAAEALGESVLPRVHDSYMSIIMYLAAVQN